MCAQPLAFGVPTPSTPSTPSRKRTCICEADQHEPHPPHKRTCICEADQQEPQSTHKRTCICETGAADQDEPQSTHKRTCICETGAADQDEPQSTHKRTCICEAGGAEGADEAGGAEGAGGAGGATGAEHQHVVDVQARQLMCVCRGCYLLFTDDSATLRYRAVPDRYLQFPGFALAPGLWDRLEIPVGVAFFFRNSAAHRTTAFYPGPAGATESELPLDAWSEVIAANPGLEVLRDDVEALLIRVSATGASCHLVPVDACYELVGRIRMVWRGFDGGQDAHRRMDEFFTALERRSRSAP